MLRGTDRHRDRADARDFLCRSRAGGEERGSPEPQMEPFARAARTQGRTAAQPRGLDRAAPERKLAAKSPPHLHCYIHTPLSLPLERDRLHARGGARKAKGTCSATAFFLRLPCPDWLDGGSRLACNRKVSCWTSSEMLVLGLGFSSSPNNQNIPRTDRRALLAAATHRTVSRV